VSVYRKRNFIKCRDCKLEIPIPFVFVDIPRVIECPTCKGQMYLRAEQEYVGVCRTCEGFGCGFCRDSREEVKKEKYEHEERYVTRVQRMIAMGGKDGSR